MMHRLKVPRVLVQTQIYTLYPFFTRKVLAIKLWQYEPVYLFAFEVFLSVIQKHKGKESIIIHNNLRVVS